MTLRGETLGRRPTLADDVAGRLRAAIAGGELKAGDKLPPEHVLASLYGVSRPVVREAISQLKSEGILTSHQGRGAFVNREGLAASRRLDLPSPEDPAAQAALAELLAVVEAGATALAAQRRSAGELAAIQGHCRAMAQAVARGESGVDQDVAFHRAIVAATHNPYFIAVSDFLDHHARRFIRSARANTASQLPELLGKVQGEHERIVAAIEGQDAAGGPRGPPPPPPPPPGPPHPPP
ncbi:MAG: FadR/GntR family transcriptional regulator, partial [Candidatus Competibacterales bacterium]